MKKNLTLFSVTRSVSRHLAAHNITRDLVVRMERNIMADSLNYLTHQPTNSAQAISGRRSSIASTSLFAIGNTVREAGFDRFARIVRSNQVNVGASTSQASLRADSNILNVDFDPIPITAATADAELPTTIENDFEVNASAGITNTFDSFGEEIEFLYVDERTDDDKLPTTIQNDFVVGEPNVIEELKFEIDPIAIATVSTEENQGSVNPFDAFGENIEFLYDDVENDFEVNAEGASTNQAEEQLIGLLIEPNLESVAFNVPIVNPSDEQLEKLDEHDLYEPNVITTIQEPEENQTEANEESESTKDILYVDVEWADTDKLPTTIENIFEVTAGVSANRSDEQMIDEPISNETVRHPFDEQLENNHDLNEANAIAIVPEPEENRIEVKEESPNTNNGDKEKDLEAKLWSCSLFNDFDPFQRLPNLPFSLSSRRRAMSVDSYQNRSNIPVEPQSSVVSTATTVQTINSPRPLRRRRLSIMKSPKLETIAEEDEALGDIKNLFQ